MMGPSSLETGSGHVTRLGAREVFGVLAVVVVLSGCARFETSGDAFTRRPSEAYHQIIMRDAYSHTHSPVLAGDPQGCFHCGTVPQEEILRPGTVAATGDGFHATPQTLGAAMVSPPGPGAGTARRPAGGPVARVRGHRPRCRGGPVRFASPARGPGRDALARRRRSSARPTGIA